LTGVIVECEDSEGTGGEAGRFAGGCIAVPCEEETALVVIGGVDIENLSIIPQEKMLSEVIN
jgi:hypothetical protein